MKQNPMEVIGEWAFVIGVIIAVAIGIFGKVNAGAAIVLVVIGLIVGLLNVTSREATPFLLAGISLLIATAFGGNALADLPKAVDVLKAIMILVVPAVIIVALREVFLIAKEK